MKVFSDDFEARLRSRIISIVRDAFQVFLKEKSDETRYLQQKDARAYIGGISGDDFNQLVKEGLPEIKLGPSNKHKRYDKRAIDEYMLKHSSNKLSPSNDDFYL